MRGKVPLTAHDINNCMSESEDLESSDEEPTTLEGKKLQLERKATRKLKRHAIYE